MSGEATKSRGRGKIIRVSNDSVIRIPKHMVKWRLPLVYKVESVERNGDVAVVTIRIVSEGGGA
jgi:hypothetical protein